MNNPATYIGFFQARHINGTKHWCFFPVFEEVGDKYEMNFPHNEFHQGRIQLKQRMSCVLQNVALPDIHGAKENVLQKVTFEGDLFATGEGRYYNRIELPEDMCVEDAIRVEKLSLSDIVKNGAAYVMLEVAELRPLHKKEKTVCCVEKYENRPEFGGLFKTIADVPYAIFSKDNEVLSAGVKLTPYFYSKAHFDLTSLDRVFDLNSDVETLLSIPFYVDELTMDGQFSPFESVEYMNVVRLKESAVPRPGCLKWNGEGYDLERTGNPIQGD